MIKNKYLNDFAKSILNKEEPKTELENYKKEILLKIYSEIK